MKILVFLPGDIAENTAPYFVPSTMSCLNGWARPYAILFWYPEIGKVEIAPFAYTRAYF